jgi:hypothetical protein
MGIPPSTKPLTAEHDDTKTTNTASVLMDGDDN